MMSRMHALMVKRLAKRKTLKHDWNVPFIYQQILYLPCQLLCRPSACISRLHAPIHYVYVNAYFTQIFANPNRAMYFTGQTAHFGSGFHSTSGSIGSSAMCNTGPTCYDGKRAPHNILAPPTSVVGGGHVIRDQRPDKNIKMTLDNRDLWRKFHSLGTEMIITKSGR